MARPTETEVFVVLAVSLERHTADPYVVGVYTDPVTAEKAKEEHFQTNLATLTVVNGILHQPAEPAKKKGARRGSK